MAVAAAATAAAAAAAVVQWQLWLGDALSLFLSAWPAAVTAPLPAPRRPRFVCLVVVVLMLTTAAALVCVLRRRRRSSGCDTGDGVVATTGKGEGDGVGVGVVTAGNGEGGVEVAGLIDDAALAGELDRHLTAPPADPNPAVAPPAAAGACSFVLFRGRKLPGVPRCLFDARHGLAASLSVLGEWCA
jgi:hypothetical protein